MDMLFIIKIQKEYGLYGVNDIRPVMNYIDCAQNIQKKQINLIFWKYFKE